MINGAHMVVYSTDADADRAFMRDVLKLPGVDVGDGWLIFGLPPSEVAFHPWESNDKHQFYLMCESIEDFVGERSDEFVSLLDGLFGVSQMRLVALFKNGLFFLNPGQLHLALADPMVGATFVMIRT